ncbi:MAG: tetratricopeptide repeat protein [Deltaproteobacteria bacterium]|nr:tetratricopeptide repeat protein [Deltaproteobacteria bacterium]
MSVYRGIALFVCLGLLAGLAAGCEEREVKTAISKLARTVSTNLIGDLEEARIALHEREWDRAARYLERFLRIATDPDERWEAWNSLIDATERAGQDRRWINAHLEAMLVEFENDAERMRSVLYRMGESQEMARQYERAVLTWTQFGALPGLSPEDRLSIYKRLAFLQMRLNRLQGAEETLHECLSLPLPDNAKGDCLYALADVSVLRDDLAGGANTAAQILDIEGIAPELHGRASFLLADIYEQQQKYAEALQLYSAIRETYPNPLAVDVRIEYLKKRVKK